MTPVCNCNNTIKSGMCVCETCWIKPSHTQRLFKLSPTLSHTLVSGPVDDLLQCVRPDHNPVSWSVSLFVNAHHMLYILPCVTLWPFNDWPQLSPGCLRSQINHSIQINLSSTSYKTWMEAL